jgi:hypothetical protein
LMNMTRKSMKSSVAKAVAVFENKH